MIRLLDENRQARERHAPVAVAGEAVSRATVPAGASRDELEAIVPSIGT